MQNKNLFRFYKYQYLPNELLSELQEIRRQFIYGSKQWNVLANAIGYCLNISKKYPKSQVPRRRDSKGRFCK